MRTLLLLITSFLAISIAINAYLYTELTLVKSMLPEKSAPEAPPTQPEPPEAFVPPAYTEAQHAFRAQEFDQALLILQQLHDTHPDSAARLKNQWFENILQQIRSNRDHSHAPLVQGLLKIYPYNSYYLYLEVELEHWRNTSTDTLAELYQLLTTPLPSDLAVIIARRIEEIYERSTLRLKEAGAWEILSNMLEILVGVDPENQEIRLDLAEAYAMQQQFSLMEGVLAYLPPENDTVLRLRELQRQFNTPPEPVAKTEPEPENTVPENAIPLIRKGAHFLVDAWFRHRSGVRLMIDTGASTTVISQEAFDNLPRRVKREFLGNYTVNTANGPVNAPVYRFNTLTVGEYQVEDIAIVVLSLQNLEADGLLGMNFLNQFRFHIDQVNSRLLLSPIDK